jgi:hypothetical protein
MLVQVLVLALALALALGAVRMLCRGHQRGGVDSAP